MTALPATIVKALLEPIDPSRVGKDGKGFSHVEAWDIRRTMNHIFGFGQWSAEVDLMELIYEQVSEGQGKPRYSVAYRARCSVSVPGATYSEWAAGDATNYPSRADAHDQAIKTAESQAFKRACVNLGDQFGLSLYKDGSLSATVGEVIGQEYADSARVPEWVEKIRACLSQEALDAVAGEIREAELSKNDKKDLYAEYQTAKSALQA